MFFVLLCVFFRVPPSPPHIDVPFLTIIFIGLCASLKCFSQSLFAFTDFYSHTKKRLSINMFNCNLEEKGENKNMQKPDQVLTLAAV